MNTSKQIIFEPIIKNIILQETKNQKQQKEIKDKERVKRIITNTKKWEQIDHKSESILVGLDPTDLQNLSKTQLVLLQQIHRKIYGYRAQDLDKSLFNPEKFVDIDCVILKLNTCKLNCFYCNKQVQLLYEYVREPMQWTLERIDNKFGHNKDNVEIACLSCNVRRRTMHHERYIFTKQMTTITKLPGTPGTYGSSDAPPLF